MYKPLATNFAPSLIIVKRTCSPSLSIEVTSLRSTTQRWVGEHRRFARQLPINSSMVDPINRPWRTHLCSDVFSVTVIRNMLLFLTIGHIDVSPGNAALPLRFDRVAMRTSTALPTISTFHIFDSLAWSPMSHMQSKCLTCPLILGSKPSKRRKD